MARNRKSKCNSIWKKDVAVVGEFTRQYNRLWQFQKALEDRINIFYIPYVRHNNMVLTLEAKNINQAASLARHANIGRYFKRRVAPIILGLMIVLTVMAFWMGYQEITPVQQVRYF